MLSLLLLALGFAAYLPEAILACLKLPGPRDVLLSGQWLLALRDVLLSGHRRRELAAPVLLQAADRRVLKQIDDRNLVVARRA